MKPARGGAAWAWTLALSVLGLGACTAADPTLPPSTQAPSTIQTSQGASTTPAPSAPVPTPAPGPAAGTPSATAGRTSSAPEPASETTLVEPTTTNTLPPPAAPDTPAPSTAGRLTARALPVPAGWKTVVRAGGMEEGYAGNGTWVHARDPRHAAYGVVTLGCADVTRDDYPDPVAALEGTYERAGEPGIGLVLQFKNDRQAAAYYRVYLRQVQACRSPDSPVLVKVVSSSLGLVDHRSSSDGDWTEVARLSGSRLTLVILSDPGHRRSRADSEALLRQLPG